MRVLDSFQCKDCENTFEEFHDNTSDEPIVCKFCESKNTKKVFVNMNFATSDGNFHKKIPNGFKTLLNHMGKRSGSLNKIDQNLGEF